MDCLKVKYKILVLLFLLISSFCSLNVNAKLTQRLTIPPVNTIVHDSTDNGPLPGQIIVDPQHPEWLKYHQGSPFFMCGPSDTEDFLYRGTRNFDGTRDGDQMQLIDKLKPTGANCIYLIAVRSHGGDGDSSQNPFIDNNSSKGLDDDILNQWERWFTEMNNNGIVIFFFFYDDNALIWDTGDLVGPEERAFIQEIVNKFEHHKNLIWVVAEEYEERYSAERVSNIAAEIRAADDHDHVIAVHKIPGLDFSEFSDDPNINQFAIQYYGTASQLHEGTVTAWNNANGRYNLNMAEAANHGTGATARKKNWAVAMGGAYVMVSDWDIANTPPSDLEHCGRLVRFFESTNFNEMSPHDELAYEGTEYVLAKPGDSYIAYASDLSADIGLKSMTEGTYNFRWLDIPSGVIVEKYNVHVDAGDQSWMKPATFGNELAVYITKKEVYTTNEEKMIFPGSDWEEAWPESQGVDSAKLNDAMSYLASVSGSQGTSQALVIRYGYLIWKGNDIDNEHNVWSVTKSFTGTVLGILIDQKKATLDTRAKNYVSSLAELYPDVTIRHFATSTSGYDAVGGDQSSTPFDPTTPLFPPGTKFQYCDSAMNQFANVLTQIAREPIENLFKRKIADKIGMNSSKWSWGDWGTIDGIQVNGGAGNKEKGISISARELARFGHLFLNRGNWGGTQLISAAWVDQATSVQVPPSLPHHSEGTVLGVYGFNWWVNGIKPDGDRLWPDAPPRTYQASGYNNNRCIIIPEFNMVIVRLGTDGDTVDDNELNTFLKKIGESIIMPYSTLLQKFNSLNSTYHNLLSDYNNLQSSYTALQDSYHELESEQKAIINELNTIRNLMYIFITTTIILLAATLYFARKPKKC